MDKSSIDRLEKVHPILAQKVEKVINKMAQDGFDVRVVQGLRTFAEQDALYSQGRTKPGNRVTNAKSGQSNHNFGLAVDLCPFKNNQPDWNDTKTFLRISREVKWEGLESGADWKFKDMPHVQLKGMSIKECQKAYAIGKLPKVWARMDELLAGKPPTVFMPKGNEILEFGDKGEAVLDLQKKLLQLGFLRPHEADGAFGKITKNALIGFQRLHNLTADGICGTGTMAQLNELLKK